MKCSRNVQLDSESYFEKSFYEMLCSQVQKWRVQTYFYSISINNISLIKVKMVHVLEKKCKFVTYSSKYMLPLKKLGSDFWMFLKEVSFIRLHLFDQKYSKNSNIVKYYNLK